MSNRLLITLRIIVSLFLLLAFLDNAYGYYQFLRWIVCASAAYTAYLAYEKKLKAWFWVFVVIAVIFNPIAPIYLSKDIWMLIDAAVIVVTLISIGKIPAIE